MALRTISKPDLAALAALAEAVIPSDDWRGAWAGGAREHVGTLVAEDVPDAFETLREVANLARDAGVLDDADQALAAVRDRSPAACASFEAWCFEGFYGGSSTDPPEGWRMLGFESTPAQLPAPRTALPEPVDLEQVQDHYDVVVVGSGPGGGAAARVLAAGGASVLIVERASWASDQDLRGDHIRGKRLGIRDVAAGPGAGNPRTVVEPDGSRWTADGDSSSDRWGLNAMCLGGGTRVWEAMAWRFSPEDFEMATRYGVPPGSSMSDWPISHSDMLPYYAQAEDELGVSGSVEPDATYHRDHPGFPMPPLPDDPTRLLLTRAATVHRWSATPIPFAINSVERDGRPACVGCYECLGHACPVGAKNGSHNTFVPRAVESGAHLLLAAQAVRVRARDGRATGVVLVARDGDGRRRRVEVSCDKVVLAAGSVETPRLLLASSLGNDQVGRHVHAHTVSFFAGLVDSSVPTFSGPGHSVATTEFVHANGSPYGGGVLFDAFSPYPLQLAGWANAWGHHRGIEHKRWMQRSVGHVVGTMSMGQEIPTPQARITLDPSRQDINGMPSVVIARDDHPATGEVHAFLDQRCREWLEAAGATDIRAIGDAGRTIGADGDGRTSPVGEHTVGTARMGDDPATSAADATGLVHGTANVYVCDGSAMTTCGGFNPTLTLVANALRISSGIADLG